MTAQHLIFRDFLERNREHFPMTMEALMALEASEIHENARLTPEQARYAYDVALEPEPLIARGELREIEPEGAP